jgi:hypothetical protein
LPIALGYAIIFLKMFPKKHWKGCGAVVPTCRDFLEDIRKDRFYNSLHHVPQDAPAIILIIIDKSDEWDK